MTEQHTTRQYDVELKSVSTRVLEMGGLAESQVAQAIYALANFSGETTHQSPGGRDRRPDAAHHRDASAGGDRSAVAHRDLESIGQPRARRRRGGAYRAHGAAPERLPVADLQFEADLACAQLRRALDAFARMDPNAALDVLKRDDQIDQEFDGLLRKLITYMMEDPRMISSSIDLVFVAKAIERVGDHAKNLAEAVIYVVKGTDVRHVTVPEVEKAVR